MIKISSCNYNIIVLFCSIMIDYYIKLTIVAGVSPINQTHRLAIFKTN